MFMKDRDPERTEAATPKRRKQARDKGSVPKSGELTKFLLLLVGLLMTKYTLGVYEREMREIFRWFLGDGMRLQVNFTTANALMLDISVRLAKMMLPTLVVLAVVAYAVLRFQVGKLWVLPWHDFSFGKMFNVMAGIKKLMLDPRVLINMGKQTALAAAIGLPCYLVLRKEFGNFMPLFYADAHAIAVYILSTTATMLWYTMVPMVAIAVWDTWYQRHDYEENLKMTKFEVKDEQRNAEGDPMVKSKQRQKMMEVISKRMMQNVPKADVVITNPTHIAVALQYDPLLAPAPIVVAMGADRIAEKIKEIARESGVPIRENKPLARALYKDAEIGQMIPEPLFQAVAAVLAQLDRFRKGRPAR